MKEIEELRALRAHGFAERECAVLLQRSVRTIGKLCRKGVIPVPERCKTVQGKPWSDEKIARVRAMAESGMKSIVIAARIGIGISAYGTARKRYGFPKAPRDRMSDEERACRKAEFDARRSKQRKDERRAAGKRLLSESRLNHPGVIAQIIAMHAEDLSGSKIGARLGFTKGTINAKIRRLGLQPRPKGGVAKCLDKPRRVRVKAPTKRPVVVRPAAVRTVVAPAIDKPGKPALALPWPDVEAMAIAQGQRRVRTHGFDLAALNAARVAGGQAPVRPVRVGA